MASARFSRRQFIKITALGGAGVALFPAADAFAARKLIKKNVQTGSMSYAVLGRTNMVVSRLSLGGLPWESNVARAAIERGCNLIHGSIRYGGGRTIFEQGKGLKGLWDKVFFMLKGAVTEENINTGLKALQTDHVDLILPVFSSTANIANPEIYEAFQRFKKAGKVSFLGCTIHSKQPLEEIVDAAVKAGFYDVILTMYQPPRRKPLIPALKRAHSAGVGTVSMKTLQGVTGSREDRARIIQEALTIGEIDTVLKGIKNFDDMQVFADAVAKVKSKLRRRASLESDMKFADLSVCGGCGTCASVCPQGLDLPEIMRCVTYYAPEMEEHARQTYRSIPRRLTALYCRDCGTCERHCPRNLPIRALIRKAHDNWGMC